MNTPNTPGLPRAALTAFRSSWRTLIAYQIACKLTAFFILVPLLTGLLHALLALEGEGFVGNIDIARFALSPLGASSILLSAVLTLVLLFLELSGVVLIADDAISHRPQSLRRCLRSLLAASPRLLTVAAAIVISGAVVAVPFLAAAGLAFKLLLSHGDINFYVSTKPREFWIAVAIGGLLGTVLAAVAGVLFVRWLFALPGALLDGWRGRHALNSSASLARGRLWSTARWILGWQLAKFIVGALVLAMVYRAGAPLIRLAEAHSKWMWPSVLAVLTAQVLTIAILSAFDSIGFGLLLASAFRRLTPAAAATILPASAQRRSFAGLVVAALVIAAGINAGLIARRFTVKKPVVVTAHRAGAVRAPENTLAALRFAIEDGAQMAEIDVQETADGQVVVIHDSDLRRVCGIDRLVRDLPFAEIEKLDAGRYFSAEFAGERIPTLEQFIEAARDKIGLNIELKYDGPAPNLAGKVADIVTRGRFADQCVITSMDAGGLHQVRQLDPNLKLGYILAAGAGDFAALDVNFLSISQNKATPAMLRRAARSGMQVHVWTVNSRDDMVAMILRGADNLITDDPKTAVEVVQWYESLSDPELILLRVRQWLKR